jgi:hypothetical protein
MSQLPGLRTVGDLVLLLHVLHKYQRDQLASTQPTSGLLSAMYGEDLGGRMRSRLGVIVHQMCTTWSRQSPELLQVVSAMVQALPTGWLSAAVRALPRTSVLRPGHLAERPMTGPLSCAAVRAVVVRLGWSGVRGPMRVGRVSSKPPPPVLLAHPSMTVKAATRLQLGPVWAAQKACRMQYARDALAEGQASAPCPEVVAAGLAGLEGCMHDLWQLGWENVHKEPLWRLCVNGIRGAGGHDLPRSGPCVCGWEGVVSRAGGTQEERGECSRVAARDWRLHVFWRCPVAQAVIAELRLCLPAHVTVSCADVWLLRFQQDLGSTNPVNRDVWALVCMVAIEAIYHGFRCMWALHTAEQGVALDPTQTRITDFMPPVHAAPTVARSASQRASRSAVAWFWCLLQDFVGLNLIPASWSALPRDHPFLGCATGAGASHLVLNPPPGFVLPIAL